MTKHNWDLSIPGDEFSRILDLFSGCEIEDAGETWRIGIAQASLPPPFIMGHYTVLIEGREPGYDSSTATRQIKTRKLAQFTVNPKLGEDGISVVAEGDALVLRVRDKLCELYPALKLGTQLQPDKEVETVITILPNQGDYDAVIAAALGETGVSFERHDAGPVKIFVLKDTEGEIGRIVLKPYTPLEIAKFNEHLRELGKGEIPNALRPALCWQNYICPAEIQGARRVAVCVAFESVRAAQHKRIGDLAQYAPAEAPSSATVTPNIPAESIEELADSGHYAHAPNKRREIVAAYNLARAKGEIENKDAWARTNYGITGKTLKTYEDEVKQRPTET